MATPNEHSHCTSHLKGSILKSQNDHACSKGFIYAIACQRGWLYDLAVGQR